MKNFRVISALMALCMSVSVGPLPASAAPPAGVKQLLTPFEITCQEFSVSSDFLQKELNKGYFLDDIRKALKLSKETGKRFEEAILESAPSAALSLPAAKPTVRVTPSLTKEEQYVLEQKVIEQAAVAAETVDSSPVDLNSAINQSPFAVPAASASFSTLTGSMFIQTEDISIPGKNDLGFTLKRAYDSHSAQLYDMNYAANPITASPKYEMTRNFMGAGWRWEIPSVELKSGVPYLHMATGESYKANLTTSALTGYPFKDVVFRKDTTTDSGGNGYYFSSTKDNLKYFFNSRGQLVKIKDTSNNVVTFTYSTTWINYFDFTEVTGVSSTATSVPNAHRPLIKIETGVGTPITLQYLPASVGEPQKMVVQNGKSTLVYSFTSKPFNITDSPYTIQVPLLTEVKDEKLNRVTGYGYLIQDAWSRKILSTGGTSKLNPYGLVTEIYHNTGAVTHYAYEDRGTLFSGNTANDVFRIDTIHDQLKPGVGEPEYNKLTVDYRGDLSSDYMGEGVFYTDVTDDLNRMTTYKYKKDSLTNTPFYKLLAKTELRGKLTIETAFTYEETSKYPNPIKSVQAFSNVDSTETLSLQREFTYDAWGNLTSEKKPDGALTQYSFDPTYHWLMEKTEYLRGGTDVAKSQYKRTIMTRNNVSGKITQFEVIDQDKTLLRRENYVYDATGNVTRKHVVDGERTIVTEIGYDPTSAFAIKRMNQVTDVNGDIFTVIKQYAFDLDTGLVSSFTDDLGYVTSYQYDAAGRIITVTYPDDSGMSYHYLDAENDVEQIDWKKEGNELVTIRKTLSKWNSIGWKEEEGIYGDGGAYEAKKKYQYDLYGRNIIREDAMGNKTEITFDEQDREMLVFDPVTKLSITNEYDDVAKTITMTDRDGNVHRKTLDLMGRTVKQEVKKPEGYQTTTESAYDFVGNVVSVIDGLQRVTQYGYNAMSELIYVENPNGDSSSYEYDMRGNLTSTAYGNVYRVQNEYDEMGNLIRRKDGTNVEGIYSYDTNGNAIKGIDGKGQVTINEYNNRNRLIQKTNGDSTVTYEYDTLGQRIKMTDATGVTEYRYHSNGQTDTVLLPDGKTMVYTYDANGSRIKYKDPFEREVFYKVNPQNRLGSIHLGSESAPAEVSYRYKPSGLPLQMSVANGTSFDFQFNELGRLDELSQYDTEGEVQNRYIHQYDAVGNQTDLVENGMVSTFQYDQLNRITNASQFNEVFTYSNSSDRTTMKSDRLLLPPERTMEYDGENQLTRVTTEEGKVITYVYNGDGLLYERTDGITTSRYYYDGDQLIAEAQITDGAAVLTARYIRDDKNRPVVREDSAGNVAYYSLNSHGDVTELRDRTGNVLNQYTYDIWGNLLTEEETVANPFRYAGEFWDVATSLQYLRARWYDPAQGRFLTQDTYLGDLSKSVTLNRYVYAVNNPLLYKDPSGHKVIDDYQPDGGSSSGNNYGIVGKAAQWIFNFENRLALSAVAVPISRIKYGRLTAYLLSNALQDEPQDLQFAVQDSYVVQTIKGMSEYRNMISQQIQAAENRGETTFRSNTSLALESNADMYLALHNVYVQVNGTRDEFGTWWTKTILTDTYNFEFNFKAMFHSDQKLGWAAANFLALEEQIGVIQNYMVGIEIHDYREPIW